MLVVRLEIWPFGQESSKRHLGTVVIGNDATGDSRTGNYNAYLGESYEEDPHKIVSTPLLRNLEGRVENFPRQLGPWELLSRALISMLSNRLEN